MFSTCIPNKRRKKRSVKISFLTKLVCWTNKTYPCNSILDPFFSFVFFSLIRVNEFPIERQSAEETFCMHKYAWIIIIHQYRNNNDRESAP